jgi:flagellar biosynthesis/type III secretory pathway M-ring protein FliF/YscJ
MMFMLVRKAGRAAPMPTAEELVGIPPAIEPDSDLVGEADEGETPMMGIEIDSDQLKRQKMLQEVSELVKSNPQSAVGVFNRWLAPEQ